MEDHLARSSPLPNMGGDANGLASDDRTPLIR
jgi:hypothetical protein